MEKTHHDFLKLLIELIIVLINSFFLKNKTSVLIALNLVGWSLDFICPLTTLIFAIKFSTRASSKMLFYLRDCLIAYKWNLNYLRLGEIYNNLIYSTTQVTKIHVLIFLIQVIAICSNFSLFLITKEVVILTKHTWRVNFWFLWTRELGYLLK